MQGDRDFIRGVKEAIENFINLDARATHYLSLYTDDFLKKHVHVRCMYLLAYLNSILLLYASAVCIFLFKPTVLEFARGRD